MNRIQMEMHLSALTDFIKELKDFAFPVWSSTSFVILEDVYVICSQGMHAHF